MLARQFLWEIGAPFAWREALCGIILMHQLPFWLWERADAQRRAIEASWLCNTDHLSIHAKADANGRIQSRQDNLLEAVELAREQFAALDCLDGPFGFANAESRVSYFEKPDRDPSYAAHEDFRCTVTVDVGSARRGQGSLDCPEPAGICRWSAST